MVGTLGGVSAFLLFLLLAVQVLVHLYATSVVTAVAHDAARIVSGADGGPRAQAAAVAHAHSLLGDWASEVVLDFTRVDDDQVVLSVEARSPALLPRALYERTGLLSLYREVVVRTERFRE